MIRLRRVKGVVPLMRFYQVELTPPDADRPWRTSRALPAVTVKRRLFREGFYQRDVADLLLEADEQWNSGSRDWVEHLGVRPEP